MREVWVGNWVLNMDSGVDYEMSGGRYYGFKCGEATAKVV